MTWQTARNPDRNPAKKVVSDGITFDSKAEEKRYQDLKLMIAAGEVRNLDVHPVKPLNIIRDGFIPATKVCDFEPDFQYERLRAGNWEWVIEDVKGRRSGPAWSLFRLKAKLFEALYGRPVEVYPPAPPRKPRRKR